MVLKKNEEIYENGVKVMEKKYHDNGKLALSVTYNAKGPIGVSENFNEKGMKIRHTPYVDGHLQGVDITYNYSNGNKYVEQEYKNDILDGIYKEYYPSGKLALEGQLIKGQREGTWKYYHESGKLKQERVYENDNQVSDKRFD
ncbi:toxin-antitoxin system YwqK family antitoxin [Zobellia nedashkovskayae]